MRLIFFTAYAITILTIVGFSYLFIDPNFFYFQNIYTGVAYSHRLFVSLSYFILISLLFVFYILLLKQILNKKYNKKDVLVFLLLSSPLLFAYPAVLSYDIFNYIATAKVTFYYLENPYLVMPIEFINDPLLLYTRAANKYALYGPFWIILSGIPYAVSFYSVVVQLLVFKIFVSMFYLGTTYVLYKLSKSLFVAAFFALNPLVLIEVLVGGHNDIVMMFLALLGFYLLKSNKKLMSGVFIFLSILIKYATAFLLPVWMYVVYKKHKKHEVVWRKIWIMCLVLMSAIFVLSPLREEMYPWYFVWLLPFVALVKERKLLLLVTAMSFGFLMYYLPYMYSGHYLFIWKALSVIVFTGIVAVIIYIIRLFQNNDI